MILFGVPLMNGYLDSKSQAEENYFLIGLKINRQVQQERLVTFAMHRGAIIRMAFKLLQEEIHRDILQRMLQLQRKK